MGYGVHGGIAVGVSVLLSAPGWAQPVGFEVEFGGSINGDPIFATGSGSMDRQGMGNNNGSIGFDELPDDFTPIAMDTMLTNVCSNGFRADGGSKNLWDLGGGSYQVERTFQWLGHPGSLIFSSAVVTFDEDSQTIFSSMTLSGTYDGPTDLVAIDDYAVLWLPSSTEGEVFEAGTAVLRRANGEQLIVQFATRYFGLHDSLGAPQIGVGDFETTFDGQTLTVGWDGYFEVPAPASALVLLAAGGFASRRRRPA